MDWDAIGALGETVAAVAVVVSLIYLAAQVRSSTIPFASLLSNLNTCHLELFLITCIFPFLKMPSSASSLLLFKVYITIFELPKFECNKTQE